MKSASTDVGVDHNSPAGIMMSPPHYIQWNYCCYIEPPYNYKPVSLTDCTPLVYFAPSCECPSEIVDEVWLIVEGIFPPSICNC